MRIKIRVSRSLNHKNNEDCASGSVWLSHSLDNNSISSKISRVLEIYRKLVGQRGELLKEPFKPG